MENDPDFEDKDIDLNTTELVYIVRSEKKFAFTSDDSGKVEEQVLDYSTPQIWIKENRESGFFLKSIEAVGFAEKNATY